MAKRVEVKKVVPDKATALRVLRTLNQREAFHFFRDVGQPLGKSSASLGDFCDMLRVVDIKSVNFHQKRGDFEKWIREILGDVELAKRIGKLGGQVQGEALRNELCQTVKTRLSELKEATA
jgi:hypothetical protein